MQRLLLLKLEWHEKLPSAVSNEWTAFVKSLPALEKLKIPRCVLLENPARITLQGFGDASDKEFGAVIYLYRKINPYTPRSDYLQFRFNVKNSELNWDTGQFNKMIKFTDIQNTADLEGSVEILLWLEGRVGEFLPGLPVQV
ncbi:hypothetical protein AVEN_41687-1 [Araneus ventricosus]|uniref:Uncharacterized protein n=1 Tax=Araneus ventricosus TaxID=182803 RepID=A0A4Y2U7F0_ARAVE|nr:hypothetical protein AVEN_192905-1 [Araneus ventricosus]GBO08935.1 hypothetical protein AVEN_41687-1 [Araneus ventricosus]